MDKIIQGGYNTKIININGDWMYVKNTCRSTVNKDFSDVPATTKFKKMLLLSEHSPIRLLNVDWAWDEIEYWASTEWSRHKFEKFISTQRGDRTGKDRSLIGQSEPVKFIGNANVQHLIDAWRKRLCGCASNVCQETAMEFKKELYKYEPEVASVLVPNCIYRCGCPEFQQCPKWGAFKKKFDELGIDITNLQERYDAYNKLVGLGE